jgi:hypothetical protein
MDEVIIRNLDDDVLEAESGPGEHRGLLVTLMETFGDLGGVDLEIPARATSPRAAELCS